MHTTVLLIADGGHCGDAAALGAVVVHAERHVASALQKLQLGIWQLDTGQLKTGEAQNFAKQIVVNLTKKGL